MSQFEPVSVMSDEAVVKRIRTRGRSWLVSGAILLIVAVVLVLYSGGAGSCQTPSCSYTPVAFTSSSMGGILGGGGLALALVDLWLYRYALGGS